MTKVEMYPQSVSADDNPFITILVDGLKENGVHAIPYVPFPYGATADALHVHWLEQVTWGRLSQRLPGMQTLLARRLVRRAKQYRAAGRPVVWTVHNLSPHEQLKGDASRAFTELRSGFLPLVTDVIFMSAATIDEVLANYPEVIGAARHVIPHPHFRRFFSSIRPCEERKTKIGLHNRVPTLAVVGMLRGYKGIPQLVSMAKALDECFLMVIAGYGDLATCDAIDAAIANDKRFVLDRRRLSHSDVATILSNSDLAVFNFQSILNSGSVLTALSLNTPVLCPASGSLAAIASDLGPEWVSCFDPPLSSGKIAEAIRDIKRSGGECTLDLHDPVRVGAMHRNVYIGATQ